MTAGTVKFFIVVGASVGGIVVFPDRLFCCLLDRLRTCYDLGPMMFQQQLVGHGQVKARGSIYYKRVEISE